ncbi:hypothetical protein ACFPN7_17745 [Amycolatopsis halotolerans]|uniref:hypothetical protein n=1 Tax=Amycolatopsis halotolerans TaxID=330083 RepID=UPI0036220848
MAPHRAPAEGCAARTATDRTDLGADGLERVISSALATDPGSWCVSPLSSVVQAGKGDEG